MRSAHSLLLLLALCSVGCGGKTQAPAALDPCAENNGGCPALAICAAKEGAAVCTCQAGYAGDGQTCRPAVVELSAGTDRSCVLRSDGAAYCWGQGPLGDGVATSSDVPVRVAIDRPLATISTGFRHTCAIARDGSLWCWGWGDSLPRGDGSSNDQFKPMQIGSGSNWLSVSAGRENTCGIRTGGELWCWGMNAKNEVGDGTTERRPEPMAVLTDDTWKQVSSSTNYTCAIKSDGTLWCWGVNQGGRFLDTTDLTPQLTPLQIGMSANWKSVMLQGLSICGLQQDDTLWCWGENVFGQLGTGDTDTRTEPARIAPTMTWASIGPAYGHTLAVRADGSLWGWGDNFASRLSGELKVSGRTLRPTQLQRDSQWLLARGGGLFSCAVKTDATVWCWGDNEYGQLGAGKAELRLPDPQQVLLPE